MDAGLWSVVLPRSSDEPLPRKGESGARSCGYVRRRSCGCGYPRVQPQRRGCPGPTDRGQGGRRRGAQVGRSVTRAWLVAYEHSYRQLANQLAGIGTPASRRDQRTGVNLFLNKKGSVAMQITRKKRAATLATIRRDGNAQGRRADLATTTSASLQQGGSRT